MLRKALQFRMTWTTGSVMCATTLQAARDIASTIAASQNRVFLNSDSLLLNLVSVI